MIESTLSGWKKGPPPFRDDGSLAIVLLHYGAINRDILETYGDPIIVRRWNNKMKTTAGGHRIDYDDVYKYIDIALPEG